MLEVKSLEFGFDSPLVSGLSFAVPKGEIRLLHGPKRLWKIDLIGTDIWNAIFQCELGW